MRRRLWKGVVSYYEAGAVSAFGTSPCSCLGDSKTQAQCVWHRISGD